MATTFRFIADLERNLANHTLSGSLIFTEESIYIVKSDGTKVKYNKKETYIVNTLPLIDVDVGSLYLLTIDKSINVYDGNIWTKYGKTDLSEFTTDDLIESETKKFVSPSQINDWENIKEEVIVSRGDEITLGSRLNDIDEKVSEVINKIDGGTF